VRRILPALLFLLSGCHSCRREKPHFPDLKNAPQRVIELVEEGDYFFGRAMKHLMNSDPGANPDGWFAENKKALEFFKRAMAEGYDPAQEVYGPKTVPPQELLDRIRETMMRQSLCRKRAVSTRR